eukprot:2728998-Rhodomonas_salina.1
MQYQVLEPGLRRTTRKVMREGWPETSMLPDAKCARPREAREGEADQDGDAAGAGGEEEESLARVELHARQ